MKVVFCCNAIALIQLVGTTVINLVAPYICKGVAESRLWYGTERCMLSP